ncbi:MAG: YdcF family protein [Kurthia sp.]|nr:YdcF family protein [Candidatus Kurthia equi]
MDIYIILIASILFFTISFIFLNHINPTSLFTGMAFILALLALMTLLFALLSNYNERLAYWIVIPIALIFVLIAVFWIVILVTAVLINTRIMLKRERKSVANLLPLISLISIIVVEIVLAIINYFLGDYQLVKILLTFVNGCISYFIFIFLMYAFTATLYKLLPSIRKIDYILILGAGLNKDRVTPLLASRIDAGIKFFHKQKKRRKHQPTIILCGGQGPDELISEALAMKNYVDETYGTDYPIYLEDKSTTTLENIAFAEKIAQKQDGIHSFKESNIALATSDYHLLRAGKIAQTMKISTFGVGGKTRFYYIPTAFIREFIGYVVLKKRFHLIILLVILLLSIAQYLL